MEITVGGWTIVGTLICSGPEWPLMATSFVRASSKSKTSALDSLWSDILFNPFVVLDEFLPNFNGGQNVTFRSVRLVPEVDAQPKYLFHSLDSFYRSFKSSYCHAPVIHACTILTPE